MNLDKVGSWRRSPLAARKRHIGCRVRNCNLRAPVARNRSVSLLIFMISLTDSAITHLKSLIAEKNAAPGTGLRLRVEKGGCAGMQYVMGLDQPTSEDSVLTQEGVTIIIDHDSLGFLRGSQIDYTDSLADSGFKLTNPNATRSCGCGTSFEPLAA
uniref:HesB/IscA family protein n=1 Tax=Prosthecobacter sp. TaxID=1965333 RepID=UPI0037830934